MNGAADQEKAIVKKRSKSEIEEAEKQAKSLHGFYKMKVKDGELKISFKKIEFLKLLKTFGIYSHETDVNTIKFIKLLNKTVEEINEKQIMRSFLQHIDSLPEITDSVKSNKGGESDEADNTIKITP